MTKLALKYIRISRGRAEIYKTTVGRFNMVISRISVLFRYINGRNSLESYDTKEG